ncbi:hypothetical protein MPDQ_001268 [Monascus purpureus]|uniref:Hemimethylated DNA-binding domain-containing protein n=1 Tax=Monascus purpureus TaxID=5098 RepID=A0A507QSD0_MONPU|nr:hypothetical protein MPDQ_001268 [Monascus purpureus]
MPSKLTESVWSVDWKELYITRCLVDRAVTHVLDSILASQTGRIEKFHTIISFGYDVKDTLVRHSLAESSMEDHLARRSIAVSEWSSLVNGEHVSLEQALGAFDLFIPESGYGDSNEISAKLRGIVTELLACNPDIELLTPRVKALLVASFLRENNLTGIESGRDYHCLEHNFLGFALSDPGHNSLPLISAAIYCYVAQNLGLNARPCGFPFHVHVIVIPPSGLDMDGNKLEDGILGQPLYMDPFRSDRETPISDLENQLNFLGASSVEKANFLGESLTSEIVLRCGKNILNSVEQISQLPNPHLVPVDVASARYAAFWSSMLFTGASRPMDLRNYLPWLMEIVVTEFPSDVYLIEKHILPLFQGMLEYDDILDGLHVMQAVDGLPKQVRRRTVRNKTVLYRIGQVFQHRRYGYRAIITGWDAECGASEQWMRTMNIDQLQASSHQSFYHVLVEDKSVRYVAEENIEIITPHVSELPRALLAIAGKHFKRWDGVTRTFVSNMRDEYPDD